MAQRRFEDENLYFNYFISNEPLSFNHDMEYHHFLTLINTSNVTISYGKVQDIRSNLFSLFPEYSLVTSVSADFEMSVGILRKFKVAFNHVERLRAENVLTGGVAYLNYDNSFVYYLVAKPVFFARPTYFAVWSTLQALKNHVVTNNVRKLASTQIGAYPDNLRWPIIKQMMEYIFKDVDIEILAVDFTVPLNNNFLLYRENNID